MTKETNLNKIKEVARALLQTDIHMTEFSPMVVQHPFTNSGMVAVKTDGEIHIANITENESDLRGWRENMTGLIDKADNPHDIYMMVNKSYGLTFLHYAEPYLSAEDFSNILSDAWIRSENPNMDRNLNKAALLKMFRKADADSLMSPEEQEQLAALEDIVTVYRGLTSYNKSNIRALSWTLNYDVADWFANRFREDGTVYEAQIKKAHIFALFNGRSESEVIVDPAYLTNIQQAQEPENGLTLM